MSQKTVASIIGRAAVSKDFLNTLKNDPDKVIEEHKNDLTDDEVKSLKAIDHGELDRLHKATENTSLAAFIDKGI